MAASSQAPAAADNVDPVYEWLDDGDSYLLRLNLPEFKKEDFRVYVDAQGRLTVIGHRKPTPGAGGGEGSKAVRLHKAFQLPSTANLDAVSGRFDGTVLTLKVPKLQQEQQQPAAAVPLLPPPSTQAKEEADGGGKPAGHEDKAAASQAGRDAETEKARVEAEKAASLTARGKEEDEKAKPVPAHATEKARPGGGHQDDQDEKAWAEHREKVAREAARRIEAARARVAEAKAKAERERQCEHRKERAVEEGFKLADAVIKNKEVILATAVAAFTLGVFVSHKLFSRS